MLNAKRRTLARMSGYLSLFEQRPLREGALSVLHYALSLNYKRCLIRLFPRP